MNIEAIRKSLPFARAYNWEINIPSYDEGKWFPAHTLGETAFNFKNDEVDYGVKTFQFPSGASSKKQLSVSMYEVDKSSVETWLKDWSDELCDDKAGVALLGQGARDANLYRYDIKQNPAPGYPKVLQVVPDGEVSYQYSSTKNELVSVELTLIVVGSM